MVYNIIMKSSFYITSIINGEQAFGQHAWQEGDTAQYTGFELFVPSPFQMEGREIAPVVASFFTAEQVEAVRSDHPSIVAVEVPEADIKSELYSEISDFSKDLYGSRERLDVDLYTVEELRERLDSILESLRRERMSEEEKAEEERQEREAALARNSEFDEQFGSLAGVFS